MTDTEHGTMLFEQTLWSGAHVEGVKESGKDSKELFSGRVIWIFTKEEESVVKLQRENCDSTHVSTSCDPTIHTHLSFGF